MYDFVQRWFYDVNTSDEFKMFINKLNKEMIYNKLEKFIIQYMSDDKNMIFNLYLCKLIVMHCP